MLCFQLPVGEFIQTFYEPEGRKFESLRPLKYQVEWLSVCGINTYGVNPAV